MSSENSKVSVDEIIKHNTTDDCWIVVNNQVWDITQFAPSHPGGPGIIYKYAGHDATKAYEEIHASSVIKDNLPSSALKGQLDSTTITDEWQRPPPSKTVEYTNEERPPLQTLLNSHDFEIVAAKHLSAKTWAFYSSAATDLYTRDANKTFFDRIWFRPRVLRNVRDVSTKVSIMGQSLNLPIFVSPAAMAKLAHHEGELAIARACAARGAIQSVSTNASYPVRDIVKAVEPTYPFLFQLYINKDRAKTEELLAQLRGLPSIKAIMVTVDAPVSGKREADERLKADENLSTPMSKMTAKNDAQGGGLGRIMGSFIDPSFDWASLAWLRKHTQLPLILKGVQSAADAQKAMEMGIAGLVLSNHGGRSLDTSPPAILLLLELHRCCPQVFERMEIYVDGGVRRGTDILKALCLGATAVGIGRPFLYAVQYGQEGVEHLISLLHDELETSMRMIGLTDLKKAHPGLVNTAELDPLVPATPEGHPWIRWRSGTAAKL